MRPRISLKYLLSFGVGAALTACHGVTTPRPATVKIVPSPVRTRASVLAAPKLGSLAQAQDAQIFKATRAWKGTPRWALAVNDDDYATPHVLHDFSCAAGFEIDANVTPHLQKLVDDLMALAYPSVTDLKRFYARPRPYVGNNQPTCMVDRHELGPYRSYPSGHTMLGTTVSFLLAALIPKRADEIYERGRIFGESRIVCGAHWASDVATGYQVAAQQMNLLMNRPEIRSQLPAAQREIKMLRARGKRPDPAQCALEESGKQRSPLRLP